MNTAYEFPEDDAKMVYVKSVNVADLPEDVQEQADGLEQLFAVHDANGERLALVAERKLAYALALQNNLAPMAVH